MFLAVLRPSTIQQKSITEINCDIRWIVNYLGDSAIQRLNNRGQADSDKPSSIWEEVKIQHSDYKVSLLLFCRHKENKRKNKVEKKKNNTEIPEVVGCSSSKRNRLGFWGIALLALCNCTWCSSGWRAGSCACPRYAVLVLNTLCPFSIPYACL